jgi:septal ring factor EnvC (AmiA/AmiB activator)
MHRSWTPPRSRFPTAAALLLALALLLPRPCGNPFAATRLEDTRQRLDSLSRVQDRLRARLAELARREEGGLRRLDRLEEQGADRRDLRRQLEHELVLLQASEELAQEELAAGRLRLDSLGGQKGATARERERVRAEAAALARRLFPLRHLDALGLWLQTDTRARAGRSLRRLPWLASGLQRRLAELAGLAASLGSLERREGEEAERRRGQLERLERDRRRAAGARAEAARELKRLEGEQAEQGRLLKEVRQDRGLAAEQAGRLRRAGEEVARQLEDLQRKWTERETRRESESRRQSAVAQRLAAQPGASADASAPQAPRAPAAQPSRTPPADAPPPLGGLAARRGKLPAPVGGRITRPFGERQDPLLGTVLDNPGVDYTCAPGAPVKAVHEGRVEKLTWVAGFGNTLLVSHGGGCWTVYAKLEDVGVREGQAVAAGQVLGRAGRFDSPDTGTVHFELWQDQRPRDPRAWLKP